MWEPFEGVREIRGLSRPVFVSGRFSNPSSWNEQKVSVGKMLRFRKLCLFLCSRTFL